VYYEKEPVEDTAFTLEPVTQEKPNHGSMWEPVEEERSVAAPRQPQVQAGLSQAPSRLALPDRPHAPVKMEIPRERLSNVPQIPMNAFVGPLKSEQTIATKQQVEQANEANEVNLDMDEATTASVVLLSSPARLNEMSMSDEITVVRAPSIPLVPSVAMTQQEVVESDVPTLTSLIPKIQEMKMPQLNSSAGSSSFSLSRPFASLKDAFFGDSR
jgi:hypothetical protein